MGYFVDGKGRLIPKTHSAFCFFPTKEVTGLNFIIHAPFLLTDSREGIRAGVQHNLDMVSLLSKLAADSLVYLRDIGQSKSVPLIDDDIFDIVPYSESGFEDVSSKKSISFKPFFTTMKEAFESEAIIPATTGYVATENAYWAFVPQITELFSDKQLAALAQNDDAKWAFASFGRQDTLRKNKKLTEYIDSITTTWLDDALILNGWSQDGESCGGVTAPFIESQPIEWLHRFYKWIGDAKGRTDPIRTKPIFLNQKGKAVAAFDAKKHAILFLPTDGGSGYDTINDALLQNEDTLAFVKQLGISEPSLRDEIYNIILPQYKDEDGDLDGDPHFKKFFQYYQTCSRDKAEAFLQDMKEVAFISHSSASDKTIFQEQARTLYLPFEPLPKWFATKPETKFVSFDNYLELVGEDKKRELVAFLTALGVGGMPRLIGRTWYKQEEWQAHINWEYSSRGKTWTETSIDGCKELIESVVREGDPTNSVLLWSQLLEFVKIGYLRDGHRPNVLFGQYEYFYRKQCSRHFESSNAELIRNQPWLMNSDGDFVSASDLTVQTLNYQYNVSGYEARELFHVLGIKEKVDDIEQDDTSLARLAEELNLSKEEQQDAFRKYADDKNKKVVAGDNCLLGTDSDLSEDDDFAGDEDVTEDDESEHASRPSVKRVGIEITKRATSAPDKRPAKLDATDDAASDEDDYSKPAVDISKKIEKIKEQAEQEIQEIARLEDLKQHAQDADIYSYGWFKALLELESINGGENSATSREISILFAKVGLEAGTTRTLILKHPNRYIPQSMEDLADIPLELHFAGQPMVKVAVEVVSVKSNTLRAKLRTNAQIDGTDLSLVTEARIVARNPVFLMEELRNAFIRLGDDNGYDDDFDMQENLCENIEFVFGPPGTGKTTYVAKDVILPLMKSVQDLKVLVLTPTNKSADVLVRRLMESMGADKSYLSWLVRFGATGDSHIEQSGVFRDKTFDIRTFPRNVTVTTIARFPYDYFLPEDGTRLHLSALKWDYIIFDEASMIPLANIVYPLYKKTPEKFIIAGDPFQIEPITAVEEWKDENIYTMVELDSFTNPTTIPHDYHVELLTTQYRSIPEIGEVFSQFAYGGVLEHFRSSESQRTLPIGEFLDIKPLNIIKFPVSKFESIYRPKRLQIKTPYQVYSALFAFEFVKHLASLIERAAGSERFRIGLITPYRAQADLIDKLMASIDLPNSIDVQVGTIHGFQGDECDVIIALFNPPPSISTHKGMFLNKLNIVNVSISRARDYLFVLMPDDETENVGNLTLIKRVERLCKEQQTYGEHSSSAVEEQMFGSKTYLEDNSFSTSHQLVNVYGKPEKKYEVRSEDSAVDVQIHHD